MLTVGALFVAALARSGTLAPSWQDVGRALSAVGIIVALYERFLWRWLPLPGRPPVLRGTWKVRLTPRKGPKGLLQREVSFLRLAQTASTIHARFLFQDGESRSTTATFAADPDGGTRLLLFYEFEPDDPAQQPRRKGAAALAIGRVPQVTLRGRYWNDVQIWGDIQSEGRSGVLYEHFADAKDGDYVEVKSKTIAQRLRSLRRP